MLVVPVMVHRQGISRGMEAANSKTVIRHAPTLASPGPVERVVAVGVLVLLAAIAGAVWRASFHLNPAVELASTLQLVPGARPAVVEPGWLGTVPTGLAAMGAVERFDSESLSEKIDGKAELYVEAGFASLESRRLSVDSNPALWFEALLFTMQTPRAAYAVYSAQRRPGAANLPSGTGEGYGSGNGLFLTQGRQYVEIIAADPAAMTAANAYLADLRARLPIEAAALGERDLFPPDLVDASSCTLIPENAFGCDRLANVMTAVMRLPGGTCTVFVSLRDSPAEARELAGAYLAFLVTNGGQAVADADPPQVDLYGFRDAVFAEGRIVGGVHEVADGALATDAARRLRTYLQELPALAAEGSTHDAR